MAPRSILFDTTRLLTRRRQPSPSGIDRVDLAYAGRFLTGQPGRSAVAITPFGTRILPGDEERGLLAELRRRWAGPACLDEDPALERVRTQLAGGAVPAVRVPARPTRRIDLAAEIARARMLAWTRAEAAPRGAVYLHTSHLRLDRPGRFTWLDRRPDVRPVFFVHDLIPIEHPEYVVPGEDARHRIRMRTVSERGAAIIVNSQDVGTKLAAFLAAERLRVPPIAVAPLAAEPAFSIAVRTEHPGRPYFVICSTIEARKNHLLLLQVWRDLVAGPGRSRPGRSGPDVPALVIVGQRGWESEAAVDLLDRCPSLRGHVIEAPGLSTPGLAALLGGARALLMPSFAEGYGIPVVEALGVGTPVVASDLPVFREVTGDRATLLDPLDGLGWADAVMRMAGEPVRTVAGVKLPTWERHFEIVDEVLAGL